MKRRLKLGLSLVGIVVAFAIGATAPVSGQGDVPAQVPTDPAVPVAPTQTPPSTPAPAPAPAPPPASSDPAADPNNPLGVAPPEPQKGNGQKQGGDSDRKARPKRKKKDKAEGLDADDVANPCQTLADEVGGAQSELQVQGELSARERRALLAKERDADRRQAELEDLCEQAEERKERKKKRKRKQTEDRNTDGSPAPSNPGFMDAGLPGPATVTGVPNFVIRKFKVPVFLLPIYQAAGIQYGVRWEVLAAINEIETDYGRNLNVSSAGALGWMQFMPATWRAYGTDANKDGKRDPYNPVDAIFAAARYLKAAGYEKDVKRAIFAYNHADWYVDSVMLRAKLIAGVPSDLTGSLTGLTEGRFPVYAKSRYADDLSEVEATKKFKRGQNAARVEGGKASRNGIEIYSRPNAPVVATNDGIVKKIGKDSRGKFIVLQDVYGNQYSYYGLSSIQRTYPVPKDEAGSYSDDTDAKAIKANAPDKASEKLPKPRLAASAGRQAPKGKGKGKAKPKARKGTDSTAPAPASEDSAASNPLKQRLFAHPARPAARSAGGAEQLLNSKVGSKGYTTFSGYFSRAFGLDAKDVRLKPMRKGARVIGGTILGRIGKPDPDKAAHLYFEIRPAGRGAPRIDPKPILDGWKLLEATAIYRASGRNALYGDDEDNFSIGQVMLLPKPLLEKRVLSDSRIDIYPGGRQDIQSGQIDRRVLVTLAFLAESGLKPSVTSLKSGHGVYTKSGNVSHHSSGNAVDISQINGVPILGHQEEGGVTEQAIDRMMALQGTVQPAQVISLIEKGGPTLAMADHADHIHVGFRPMFGANKKLGKQAFALLKPGQWEDLVKQLGTIENPVVPTKPSRFALPAEKNKKRSSEAHAGE
ncbi:MAG: lytic murein transglycosylase [Thermoleophilaceae bacterium]|nr:lytic murein transglycosylase [Thermoleophilaceae bacterium]